LFLAELPIWFYCWIWSEESRLSIMPETHVSTLQESGMFYVYNIYCISWFIVPESNGVTLLTASASDKILYGYDLIYLISNSLWYHQPITHCVLLQLTSTFYHTMTQCNWLGWLIPFLNGDDFVMHKSFLVSGSSSFVICIKRLFKFILGYKMLYPHLYNVGSLLIRHFQ